MEKIRAVKGRDELVIIQNSMKQFKAAYTDLLTMARAAVQRLTNATKDAKQELQKQKSSEPAVKKRGRRPAVGGKDTKAAGGGNLVDNPMVGCAQSLITVVVNNALVWADLPDQR